MDGAASIKGDLNGFGCRLLLCRELCDLEGVGSACADLNRETGVGVSGGCMEENAFLAEVNVP